jgi:hypothetical protein
MASRSLGGDAGAVVGDGDGDLVAAVGDGDLDGAVGRPCRAALSSRLSIARRRPGFPAVDQDGVRAPPQRVGDIGVAPAGLVDGVVEQFADVDGLAVGQRAGVAAGERSAGRRGG